jgi:hypothetical protein
MIQKHLRLSFCCQIIPLIFFGVSLRPFFRLQKVFAPQPFDEGGSLEKAV